jgi:hypothetical protein
LETSGTNSDQPIFSIVIAAVLLYYYKHGRNPIAFPSLAIVLQNTRTSLLVPEQEYLKAATSPQPFSNSSSSTLTNVSCFQPAHHPFSSEIASSGERAHRSIKGCTSSPLRTREMRLKASTGPSDALDEITRPPLNEVGLRRPAQTTTQDFSPSSHDVTTTTTRPPSAGLRRRRCVYKSTGYPRLT